MDDIPILLQEMRMAWNNKEAETEGDKRAIEWLRDDPKGFRSRMAALEKALTDRGRPAEWDRVGVCPTCGGVSGAAVTTDDGRERAEKLIEKVLAGAKG